MIDISHIKEDEVPLIFLSLIMLFVVFARDAGKFDSLVGRIDDKLEYWKCSLDKDYAYEKYVKNNPKYKDMLGENKMSEIEEECANSDWNYEDCCECEQGTVCKLPKRMKYEFESGIILMNPNNEPDDDFFETD